MRKPYFILIIFCGLALMTGSGPSHAKSFVCEGHWYRARLTTYTSYPDPGSEECLAYNGCTWAGQFYGVEGKKTQQWVAQHNIVSVHKKDWPWLGLKVINIRQGSKEITAGVYDLCDDRDCEGCCTQNLGGDGYLIDMEKYTTQRFGASDGLVEFQLCHPQQ